MLVKQTASAVALGVACAGLVSGCARGSPCLPQPLVVSPTTVSAGSGVTVSSPPAECDLGYGTSTTYNLSLLGDGAAAVDQGTVVVARDGSFVADMDIPPDFPPGPTTILVTGSAFDACHDEGSCAAYVEQLTVTE